MHKPDFIIIGAMKSATTTLHDQLAQQEGFFMSEPKEPNFFSDDDVYAQGESWYSQLFDGHSDGHSDGQLCGESSTHYTKRPTWPKVIERMDGYGIDSLKLIYIIRHPIDRLVSHYIHEWSQGLISKDINEAVKNFPELIAFSKYAEQIAPFIQRYGTENILLLSFDELTQRPQETLERSCTFLGHAKTVTWRDDLSQRNVSSERVRKFPLYSLLIDSALMTSLRRTFFPKSLRNKIRHLLTMKKRPQLSEQSIQDLQTIFNADLHSLSEQLDTTLNCNNFRDVASTSELNWK
ncbi:MAG: hypothetical protein ACI93R_000257 [Flavobacteriales bacterium]|jgi:hypothetical protein